MFHGQLRGVLKKIKGCWKIWQTKHFLFNNINSKKLAMTKINKENCVYTKLRWKEKKHGISRAI